MRQMSAVMLALFVGSTGMPSAALLAQNTASPARPNANTAAVPTAETVHTMERERQGLGPLRPGADSEPGKPHSANYDEAKVGTLPLPPLFTGTSPPSPEQWNARRLELARLVEDNWVGRIPESVAQMQIVWRKEVVASNRRSQTEHWIGQITAPDGRMGPVIDATITFPAAAKSQRRAPSLIDYTYVWPFAAMPRFDGPPAPDAVQEALKRGFAHVAYRPQMLQADTAATMEQGVIGLARWPRASNDWGALRAWGWGASQLREELAKDPRINPQRISLQGHSRFGKAVLVAAAFDHAFADANVSSSGAGGTKLMRRDMGERWENMAGSGAFHWFTPAIMTYAAGQKSVADLPVDAHSLIALRAPRPLFLTSGVAEKGDAWVDPLGMWQALQAASPAWALFGHASADGPMPKPGTAGASSARLGWFQHTEGHIPWPGVSQFYAHEARHAAANDN